MGFGTFHLAKHGFKGNNLEQSRKVLDEAIKAGITFFDTAPMYGFGLAETILGEHLTHCRDKVILATKCGLVAENGRVRHNLSYDSVLRECDASLKRLNTSCIDLYQIHWPDPDTPLKDTCKALVRLIDEGRIIHPGVSNFSLPRLKEIEALLPLYSVQNHYSMLTDSDNKELIPWCRDHNINYIAYNVFEQGLLTDTIDASYRIGKNDLRKLNPLFKEPRAFESAIHKRQCYGCLDAETALKFVLSNTDINTVLISTANTAHLYANMNTCAAMRS